MKIIFEDEAEYHAFFGKLNLLGWFVVRHLRAADDINFINGFLFDAQENTEIKGRGSDENK